MKHKEQILRGRKLGGRGTTAAPYSWIHDSRSAKPGVPSTSGQSPILPTVGSVPWQIVWYDVIYIWLPERHPVCLVFIMLPLANMEAAITHTISALGGRLGELAR